MTETSDALIPLEGTAEEVVRQNLDLLARPENAGLLLNACFGWGLQLAPQDPDHVSRRLVEVVSFRARFEATALKMATDWYVAHTDQLTLERIWIEQYDDGVDPARYEVSLMVSGSSGPPLP